MLMIFAILLLLLAFGVHVATALFLLGVSTGFLEVGQRIIIDFGNQAWKVLNSFTMLAVPLFILLGELLLKAGVTEEIYDGLNKWLNRLPGGLLHTNIGASALLAATSGSSVATAATLGIVAIPSFKRRKYNMKITLGSIAAGGTLGILIPPSINMIIYGSTAGVSIGRLFLAGFIPGAILTLAFILIIIVMTLIRPSIQGQKEERFTIIEKLKALKSFIPILFVILSIMGSIYLGWATPTEAGALGVVAVMIIMLFRKKLSVQVLSKAMAATIKTTSLILLIMVAASYLNYVLSYIGLPQQLTRWVTSLPLTPVQIVWGIIIFYMIIGTFIETIAMMVTTIPLIVPLVVSIGYDPIWFGVFLMLLCQASLITPPIGMNLYVLQSVRENTLGRNSGPLTDIVIGVLPFFAMMWVVLIWLIYNPNMALILPNIVYGG